MTCAATETYRAQAAALAWLDAFERHGGRVSLFRGMFALTPPAEDVDLPPPPDMADVVLALHARDTHRMGCEP